jgi:hypothetical protein
MDVLVLVQLGAGRLTRQRHPDACLPQLALSFVAPVFDPRATKQVRGPVPGLVPALASPSLSRCFHDRFPSACVRPCGKVHPTRPHGPSKPEPGCPGHSPQSPVFVPAMARSACTSQLYSVHDSSSSPALSHALFHFHFFFPHHLPSRSFSIDQDFVGKVHFRSFTYDLLHTTRSAERRRSRYISSKTKLTYINNAQQDIEYLAHNQDTI